MSELKKLKQADDPKKFFETFKFKLHTSMPSPQFPEYEIEFDGLEAKYVSTLEFENEELRRHVKELRERIWWLQEREYRKPFEKLLESK